MSTPRFIALYRAMQADHPTAKMQLDSLTPAQRVEFDVFFRSAGTVFIEIKEELDKAIDDLGDIFTDPDPRKWTPLDWWDFNAGVEDHPLKEILTKYAKGEPNTDLIWKEIERRLDAASTNQ